MNQTADPSVSTPTSNAIPITNVVSSVLILLLALVGAAINICCLIKKISRKQVFKKSYDLLSVQLYVADVGTDVTGILLVPLYFLDIRYNMYVERILDYVRFFPNVCITTTALLTACRYQAIKEPMSNKLTLRGFIWYSLLGWVGPVVLHVGFTIYTTVESQKLMTDPETARKFNLALACLASLYVIPVIANLVFYAMSVLDLRKYQLLMKGNASLTSRTRQNQTAMRRMFAGGLLNGLILVPLIMIIVLQSGNMTDSTRRAIEKVHPFFSFFTFMFTALLNPLIYSGWPTAMGGLKALAGNCVQNEDVPFKTRASQ